MDCATAGPFVSLLCDGMTVPDDAARHIAGCSNCQSTIRDWTEAAARLRVVAAADRTAQLPPLVLDDRTTAAGPKRAFWRAWMSPMRVPRLAAAAATFALIVSWAGWFRAAGNVIDELQYEVKFTCPMSGGGSIGSTSGSVQRVGTSTRFYHASTCHGDGRGLAGFIEPIRVHDGIVTLRLGFSTTDVKPSPSAALTAAVDPAAIRDYEYVSGQPIEVAVPGGPPVTFTGKLIQRAPTRPTRETMAALLPKPDELAITMPALLRDSKEIVVTMNAGTTAKSGNVIRLYAPGSGLFEFGLDQFEGATAALTGGAALMFEADGHKYTLYSTLPMTGGEQPRRVWVRYVNGYKPSQHGAPTASDELPSLGSGSSQANR